MCQLGRGVHFVNLKFQGIQIIRCLLVFFVNVDLKVMLWTANFERVTRE